MLRAYIMCHPSRTQKQIALECGVSQSTLSRFISEKQMPDMYAFAKILAWCIGDAG